MKYNSVRLNTKPHVHSNFVLSKNELLLHLKQANIKYLQVDIVLFPVLLPYRQQGPHCTQLMSYVELLNLKSSGRSGTWESRPGAKSQASWRRRTPEGTTSENPQATWPAGELIIHGFITAYIYNFNTLRARAWRMDTLLVWQPQVMTVFCSCRVIFSCGRGSVFRRRNSLIVKFSVLDGQLGFLRRGRIFMVDRKGRKYFVNSSSIKKRTKKFVLKNAKFGAPILNIECYHEQKYQKPYRWLRLTIRAASGY